jgi:hypothetical protein
VEGSDEVLPRRQIDARFPAERRVHHREQARRRLHDGDPPMPRRREEPGEVAGHAAAQRQDDRVAADGVPRETILEPRLGLARLRPLARGEGQEDRSRPGPPERTKDGIALEARRLQEGDALQDLEAQRRVPRHAIRFWCPRGHRVERPARKRHRVAVNLAETTGTQSFRVTDDCACQWSGRGLRIYLVIRASVCHQGGGLRSHRV